MPELPEVETNIRALRPHLLSRSVLMVETYTGRLRYPLNSKDFMPIHEKKIYGLRRRAKYIIVDMEGSHSMLIHLGMTGSFRICSKETLRKKHEHIVFHLDKLLGNCKISINIF